MDLKQQLYPDLQRCRRQCERFGQRNGGSPGADTFFFRQSDLCLPERIDHVDLEFYRYHELHGLGINGYNINIVADPGETKTVTFEADKSGVFAYYCTNFCSALHQEMQGYLMVR